LRNVHNDLFNQTLVKSINDIAHTLDKSTVAEFVESQEIFDFVKSVGIDFVQGYLLGKPSPLSTLII
jgi:EAL domain-containing protein (putative c-di-GMP-specific phosphodiesterase class I)